MEREYIRNVAQVKKVGDKLIIASDGIGVLDEKSVIAEGTDTPRQLKDWMGDIVNINERMSDVINVRDFGAKGDGVTDDTEAIQAAIDSLTEEEQSSVVIDLGGATYKVDSLPRFYIDRNGNRVGAHFTNGYFLTESPVTHQVELYAAPESPSIISSPHDVRDTGVYEGPYSNGLTSDYYTEGGRTTDHLCALFASQNCRSHGPGRAVCVGSIYSSASGNVSGNYSARQCESSVQQSAHLACEDCKIDGGFRAVNIASLTSHSQAFTGFNIGCRRCWAEGLHNGNIASLESTHGGYGASFLATVSNGSITSISVVDGGSGYTGSETLTIFDKEYVGDRGGASATCTIVDGVVTGVTVTNGGAGYGKAENITITLSDQNIKYSANIASFKGNTYGSYSANLGCSECDIDTSVMSANIAGFGNHIKSTDTSATVASRGTTVDGSARYSAAVASYNTTVTGGTNENSLGSFATAGCTVTGSCSVAIGANQCQATGQGSIVSGRRTINNVNRSFALGEASSGSASTANRKIHLLSNGNIMAAGTITGSVAFTDYAEFFENAENGVIPLGTLVELVGKKVRPANGDDILGVISATAFIAAGDSPFTWQGRFLTGEFGEILTHEIPDPDYEAMIPDCSWRPSEDETEDDRPMIPNPLPREMVTIPAENPAYNPDIPNIPRSERPEEWSCVGLIGQVFVRVADGVSVGDYLKAENGIGVRSEVKTNVRVMEIKKDGVAFCLIK